MWGFGASGLSGVGFSDLGLQDLGVQPGARSFEGLQRVGTLKP